MATRHGRPRPTTRLRCDTLEQRETPAATTVIDFAAGFTPDRLPGGIPAGYDFRALLLTDGRDQARAVFAPTRVDVRAFQTSFVFRVDQQAGSMGDGFTFALTGDDRQAVQTAGGSPGEGLGYQGLTDSVAIKFDLVDNAGEGSNSVGVFTGGAAPTTPAVSLEGTGIDLHGSRAYRADIAYDGRTLTLTLTDTFDAARTWTHAFAVDIPAAVGSDTAYAGFTAGTGLLFARQTISSWTYAEFTAGAPVNRPPVIFAPANASWLSPSSVALGVGATDDGGPGNLTYTWEVVSVPPGGAAPPIRPLFGDGGVAVTLELAGRHTFRVTVRDAQGLTATSEVSYSDPLSVPNFEVSAGTATVRAGEAVQFQTLVRDTSGNVTPENLAATWRVVSGPGSIDRVGRYTAPVDATGPVTVEAETPAYIGRYFTRRAVQTTIMVVGAFDGVDLAQNGSARVADGRLRLADSSHQAGSAFAPAPVEVRGFSTSFWFRIGDRLDYRYGDGLTFVLQNAGPAALGRAGSGLGYEGIPQSVALKLDLVDNLGEGPQSVGVYTGGAAPTIPADRLPAPPPGQGNGGLLLNTAHVFRADLTYTDGVLGVRLWDTVTGHGAAWTYQVDIPAAVGGPAAYAGFTAGTGELYAPIDVLKWTYAGTNDSGPPPDGDGVPAVSVHVGLGAGAGTITTVAGTGSLSYGGDGGPAADAALYEPFGVAVDAADNLFIADLHNHRVRRVDAVTGVITTVAGNGAPGYAGDGGPATAASLQFPSAVAVDAAGNLFIGDGSNSRVRRVDAATGVITTVAGTGTFGYGGDGGPATSASLSSPSGVAVDAAGNLYIADLYNSRVRRVDATTGIMTTVAGTGVAGYGGDGGPAAAAPLRFPNGVAVDAAGNLFIADADGQRVRRVDAATGVINTVAGTGVQRYSPDGGPAAATPLYAPAGVAVDARGNVFIADTNSHRIRRVDAATGVINTVAGAGVEGYGGDGGPATGAFLRYPRGVAVDAAGNLFIADGGNTRVRRVASATLREGGPAIYTFTIRNASPAPTDPVTVTSIADDRLGELIDFARAANGGAGLVLAPGQGFAFSTTGPAPRPLVTRVTVTAHDDEGTIATASDTATVT